MLPVFVIEGRTPPEKLERLRQRAAAQGSGRIPVYGNRAGGHFDQLGQLARRLAEALVRGERVGARGGECSYRPHACVTAAGGVWPMSLLVINWGYPDVAPACGCLSVDFLPESAQLLAALQLVHVSYSCAGSPCRLLLRVQGVPCVQAVGEAEATCAALNVAGWVSGCHTADVDALLFGAQTVYRHLHLQASKPGGRGGAGVMGSVCIHSHGWHRQHHLCSFRLLEPGSCGSAC